MEIPEKLKKPYSAKDTEERIYKIWEDSGLFNPDVCVEKGIIGPDAEPFSIVLPPPNATGVLHLGHALEDSMQDTMIRYNRMRGKRTLWLPGTDHAAIATDSKVTKILEKEGLKKKEIGREKFLERVDEFVADSRKTIVSQLRKMGASLDWSREAFTLDGARNTAVKTAFKKMYEDGLIYRGHRIVNWDPKGQTVISDDEIVYEERKAKLYTFKYSKDFPIYISTTRPETKVGDTAVAVNPEDERYKKYVGKTYEIENFCGVKLNIKIVADTAVEKDFGTGALGVTPAHSQIDSEIAVRNALPSIQVINEFGKMTVGNENVLGKKTAEAREIVAEWLRSEGLMENEEEINQNIGTAERTGGIIEPLPKLQWFVDVNKKIKDRGDKSLKELMLEPVQNGSIKILPDRFEKVYYNWVENLRDWCISRQIWYGHRIPVWYDKNGGIHLPEERKIIFVRHGESIANETGIFAGQLDHELTQKGTEQARETAQLLKDKKFSRIFASDLKRATETARIIAEDFASAEISFHPEFREVHGGDLQGKGGQNKGKLLIEVLKNNTGETLEELIKRGEKAWSIINSYDSDESIVVVGHNSFLCVMKALQDGIKTKDEMIEYRRRWHMKNAEVYEFSIFVNPSGKDLVQDEDTLDTWFSSGLWSFSTLGWPQNVKDLKTFHPTSVINPGYEILFFWVARMILMSKYLLDEIPFKNVYLHGILRDAKGQKFSKSLGNGVDPIEVINEYGADALRMSLIVGIAPGMDSKFDIQKVKAYSKFSNKIWNATRFVLEQTEDFNPEGVVLDTEDKKSEEELSALIKEITTEMEDYKFYIVAEKLYHYFWHTFADIIIERSKKKILENKNADSARFLILSQLTSLLKALHPFMPFITEEIWQEMRKDGSILMVEKWPTND